MPIEVRPIFQLTKTDDPVAEADGRVTPSRWNIGSQITLDSGHVLGRTSTGNGEAEEIAISTLLSGLVSGPNTTTAGFVPVWNSTDGSSIGEGLEVGTNPNNLLALDGAGRLPAVDASQLVNLPLPGGTHNHDDLYYRESEVDALLAAKADTASLALVATTGDYNNLSNLPVLGTASALDAGVNALNLVQLDASGLLPALDASQLVNVPFQVHTHDASDIVSGTINISHLPVAADGVASALDLVRADDTRLSDARTPTAHTHPISEVVDLQVTLDGKAALVHAHDDLYYPRADVDLAIATRARRPVFDAAEVEPIVDVLFTNTAGIPSGLSYVRPSVATRVDARGFIETLSADTPRLDYDPVTKEFKGALIEEQRTNVAVYSDDMAHPAWAKNDATVSANAALSPDGTLSADKVVESATNSSHSISRDAVSVNSGLYYTLSVYARAGERSSFNLLMSDGVAFFARKFNLNLGITEAEDIDGASGATIHSITDAGNGYWRCSMTVLMQSTLSSFQLRLNNAGDVYVGDGTSGLFVWGFQLETGTTPSSYIPTDVSAVIRAQDQWSFTGSGFSDWFNPLEGTFFLDVETNTRRIVQNHTPAIIQVDDGTSNNRMRMFFRVIPTFSDVAATVVSGNEIVASMQNNITYLNRNKIIAYKRDDFALGADNGFPIVDTSGAVPTGMNRMLIGYGEGSVLNGHVRRLTYWGKRLNNSTLQQITRYEA